MLKTIEVLPEEEALLEILREVAWGTVTVKLKNGVPVMATEIRKDIKIAQDLP